MAGTARTRGGRAAVVLLAVLCAAGVLVGLRLTGGDAPSRQPPPSRLGPADPRAGAAARRELAWLAALPARTSGPRLLSGAFGGYGSGFDAHAWSADGRLPGLISCDYAGAPETGRPVIDTGCNGQLLDYAKAGGLVMVSVHHPNPAGVRFNAPMPTGQFAELTDPSTAVGRAWRRQLDRITAGLRQLTRAGVPVLFRPLLEMNGGAFWWDRQSQPVFRAVWRQMFSYVTARLGARGHQVLWVWSIGCEQAGTASEGYYPGGDYVDVIGLDCYTNNPAGTTGGPDQVTHSYRQLSTLARSQGKPFALTEIGGDNADTEAASAVDFSAWVDALHTRFSRAAFFVVWNGPVGPQGPHNSNGASLLTDPGVINQGQLAAQGLALPAPAAPG